MNDQIYTRMILKLIRTGSQWREVRASDLRHSLLVLKDQGTLLLFLKITSVHWWKVEIRIILKVIFRKIRMGTVKPDQLTSQLNQWSRLLICYMRNDPCCLILSLLGGSVCCLGLPLIPQFIWDPRIFGWCFDLSCPPSHICAHPSFSKKQSVLSEHLDSVNRTAEGLNKKVVSELDPPHFEAPD